MEELGWFIAALSAAGNIIQLLVGLRKSGAEASKSDAEAQRIRHEMEMETFQLAQELQQAMRDENKRYLERMRDERDDALERVEALQIAVEEMGRQLEFQQREISELRDVTQNGMPRWR